METRNSRIVIADDDAINLRILTRILQRLGFQAENIYALQNPDEIIGAVKEYNPAVVISDNNYEGVWGRAGITKLVEIESQYSNVRRILFSADNKDSLIKGAEKAGLKDYILLLKPFEHDNDLERALEGIE